MIGVASSDRFKRSDELSHSSSASGLQRLAKTLMFSRSETLQLGGAFVEIRQTTQGGLTNRFGALQKNFPVFSIPQVLSLNLQPS